MEKSKEEDKVDYYARRQEKIYQDAEATVKQDMYKRVRDKLALTMAQLAEADARTGSYIYWQGVAHGCFMCLEAMDVETLETMAWKTRVLNLDNLRLEEALEQQR